MSISQLDLVLLGGRGLTSRLGSLEGAVSALKGGFGGVNTTFDGGVRPNLLLNSSFEYYNRNATTVQDWSQSVGVTLNASATDADGTATLTLTPSATVEQLVAAGQDFVAGAFVLSVAVRSSLAGQVVTLAVDHTPGVTIGAIQRLSSDGEVAESAVTPGGNDWFRFYVQGFLVGGGTVTVRVGNSAGSASNIEIDAAKFEFADGQGSFIEPTAFIGSDWGSSTIVRNLKADNIVAGTLTVGGSDSDSPRISVLDAADTEIVTIGDPSGGFYGVEVKGLAGIRIKGGGSLEVNDGGDIDVTDGDINVTGLGSVNVTGTGGIDINSGGGLVIGTGGGLTINDGGDLTVDGGGDITVSNGGNVYINNGGLLNVSGNLEVYGTTLLDGDLTLDGDLVMGVTGLFRIGGPTGKRLVWGASGMEAYNEADDRTMFLDVDTASWRFFGQNSVVLEGDGSLKAGELAWVDAAGFWATDTLGNAAFGVSGLDTHLWGGMTLDAGDVLIGDSNSYVWWDDSDDKVKMSGILSAAGGDVLIGDMGLSLAAGSNNANQVKWELTPGDYGTVVGQMYTLDTTNLTSMVIKATGSDPAAGWRTTAVLQAIGHGNDGNAYARIYCDVLDGSSWASSVKADINGIEIFNIGPDGASVIGDRWVGAGSTRAGKHPDYDASFSAFWRAGSDYALLTNTSDTLINAPSSTGTVYIRAGNAPATGIGANLRIDWNGNVLTYGRLYVGNQTSRYFHDDGTYTRFQGNLVVDGNIYFGGSWSTDWFNQHLKTTNNVQFANATVANITSSNNVICGHTSLEYTPTTENWSGMGSNGSTLLLNGLNYTTIGFHDQGNRVDYIRVGGAVMELGYNAGWGSPSIYIPDVVGIGVSQASGAANKVAIRGPGNSSATNSLLIQNSTPTTIFYTRNDGYMWCWQAWATSDEKTKRNIRPTDRGLSHIKRLNVKRYTKKMVEREEHGIVAQELQQVMPELVSENEVEVEGKMTPLLSVNFNALLSVLVKAVQELSDEVEALKRK